MSRAASRMALASMAFALLLLAPAATAQEISAQIVEHPDVVVASDFEGEAYTTPRYLWTFQARLTNGDVERNVRLDAITYLDGSVEGCPQQDRGVRPVHKFSKNLELANGERLTVGGAASSQQGSGSVYWPMEVLRKYPSPDGGQAENPEGMHTFCMLVWGSQNDPHCEAQRGCVLARAHFRAYVRHSNHAPWITQFDVVPEVPQPGQEILFQAQAEDNDTRPKPDQLRYRWDLGSQTADGRVVRHAFNTPGTYPVTLEVTDGHVTTTRTVNVTVAGPGADPGGDATNGSPGPGGLALVAALACAGLLRARR